MSAWRVEGGVKAPKARGEIVAMRIEINFEIVKGISVRAFPETPQIR